ncbi:MAG: DUF6438 domain-containing protein [Bacteroidia bacterium]|nr:hypothetical protein [Bacteroidia bacterium]MCZ2276475.1 DUF6438 domain-containing protein [Bacteroidia bacterium]
MNPVFSFLRRFLPAMVVLSFTLTCKSTKPSSDQTGPNHTDSVLLASIERTPCFGICPVYKISIYQSGYVIMHGIRHVKNTGWFSTRLTTEDVKSIKDYINQHNVYEFKDNYTEPRVADFPSAITEVNLHNQYKRIVNTDPAAPEELLNWEKFLDSFFNDQTNWELIQQVNGVD